MKTIRLNRRYRLYKEHGYQMGLRFANYSNVNQKKIQAIETACRKIFGNNGWLPDHNWYCYRSVVRHNRPAPYFIMFRRESDMTMALLKAQL